MACSVFDSPEYSILSFRAPTITNIAASFLKKIATHHAFGPEKSRSIDGLSYTVDVLYHGEQHDKNVYDEDICYILSTSILPGYHDYILSRLEYWSRSFRCYFLKSCVKEPIDKYNINDIIGEKESVFHIKWKASKYQSYFFKTENNEYQQTLNIYGGYKVNLMESKKQKQLRYENKKMYYWGNYCDTSFISTYDNTNPFESLFHIQSYISDILTFKTIECALKSSKKDLKERNVGRIKYYLGTKLPNHVFDFIKQRCNDNNVNVVKVNQNKYEIFPKEEICTILGGNYFERQIAQDNCVYVEKIKITYLVSSTITRFKGYICQEDEDGYIKGTDIIAADERKEKQLNEQQKENRKNINAKKKKPRYIKGTRSSKRLNR